MNRRFRKEGVITLIVVFVALLMATLAFDRMATLQYRMSNLEIKLQEKEKSEATMLEDMRIMQAEQERLRLINQEMIEKEMRRTRSVSNLQSRGFSRYSDISLNKDLSVADMDRIIDGWDGHVRNGTRFKGHGAAFVEASKRTGLNPIIILAHAASESQWGNSDIAREKNNFFGINCVDSNPDAGYVMGDDIDSGIINGAIWVQKNFYNNGYTTLQAMLDANYATDRAWARNIVNIANSSVRILQV